MQNSIYFWLFWAIDIVGKVISIAVLSYTHFPAFIVFKCAPIYYESNRLLVIQFIHHKYLPTISGKPWID